MCGICGFVGSVPEKQEIIKNMRKKIVHRGPDDAGDYVHEHGALGFQRLSIIDLDTGVQPMHNEDHRKTIVFNGEIYNYKSIRKNLLDAGHIFHTHSDTESILHGYEEYSYKVLDRLRGMFAFAIWDETEQQLFAARDMFGIKPFYYSIIDGCFVFASEIKSILEFPGYTREVNQEALEQYLSFQYSPMEETLFKGIYRLMPGHYLTFRDGTLNVVEYWDFTFSRSGERNIDRKSGEINSVMEDSIDMHMVSDVEVGSLLSSGIDSSYLAKRFGGKKTFSVGFQDLKSQYNEYSYVKKFLKTASLESKYKEIKPEDFWDAVPKTAYYMDEPLADASSVALYFVDKLAAEDVKVVLSGEGADELFGGYEIYKEPKGLALFRFMPAGLRKLCGRIGQKLPQGMKGRSFLIRGSKTVEERFIGNANIFGEEEKKKILKHYSGQLTTRDFVKRYYDRVKDMDDMSKMQYIDLKLWLPGDILLKADKMSMAHSLETRVPYLDKMVYETARSLTRNQKTRGRITKYTFRKAAEKFLPQNTAWKKKLGFPVPIRVWLKEDTYYKQVKKAFESTAARQFFRSEEIVHLLKEHRAGHHDYSRKIWTIYMFLVWYGIYFSPEQTHTA